MTGISPLVISGTPQRAIADISVFTGLEAARFDAAHFADFEWGISAITLGELRLGVLQAQNPEAASRRLSAYQLAQRFEALWARAAPGYVSARYEAAGLRDVAEWNVDVELVTRSPAQYWEMISEHVSAAVAALQQVDDPAREQIAKAVIAKVSTTKKTAR